MTSYTIASYLIDRLKELGIRQVFGVPGDYAFPVLNRLEADPDIDWIGTCNELNGATAADGYARLHGIGAMVATSGPGVLGASAAIGGAYTEHVPVIAIFGHPPTHVPGTHRETHHSLLNDFSGYERIYAEFTAAHAVLTEQDACSEIDRVIRACWSEKLPVFLAVPKDIGRLPADPPSAPLALTTPRSDPAQLEAFLDDLRGLLDTARRPAMLIDHLVGRYGLTRQVEEVAEATGIPYSVVFAGKSAFLDESRTLWLGPYLGPAAGDAAADRIDDADLLLRLGLLETPTNVGSANVWRHRGSWVDVGVSRARIGSTEYPGVALADVVDRLAGLVPHRFDEPPVVRRPRAAFAPQAGVALRQDRLMERLDTFFEDGDLVVLDQGTCSGVLDIRLAAGAHAVTQFCWGAIGYGLPALLGTLMAAPDRRQVLVTGDGGFQLAAQDLSTILRHGTAPIIIVLNNSTMVIEDMSNPGYDLQRYNELQVWDYAGLPAVLAPDSGALGVRARTEDELDAALDDAAKAHAEGRCTLIEVVLGEDDVSAGMLLRFTALSEGTQPVG